MFPYFFHLTASITKHLKVYHSVKEKGQMTVTRNTQRYQLHVPHTDTEFVLFQQIRKTQIQPTSSLPLNIQPCDVEYFDVEYFVSTMLTELRKLPSHKFCRFGKKLFLVAVKVISLPPLFQSRLPHTPEIFTFFQQSKSSSLIKRYLRNSTNPP